MILEDALFRTKRFFLGARRVRRARLFGIGIGKTGTNSICKVFSKNVRAVHEAQALPLIRKYIEWQKGGLSDGQMTDWVCRRDREMALEVDASAMNILILDILVREFSDARFVLTVRDCYSWLNSMFNHALRVGQTHPEWEELRKLRRGNQKLVHQPGEMVLKEHGLMTLDWYLSAWTRHNEKSLATVPPQRLLVVRTNEIRERAAEIAGFAGLPRWALRLHRAHAYQNPLRKELIHQVDRNLLEQKVQEHCRPLMDRFFPEIKSLDDAKL